MTAAEAAFRAGEHELVAELFCQHPIEMWFAARPSELQTLLSRIPRPNLRRDPIAALTYRMVMAESDRLAGTPRPPEMSANDDEPARELLAFAEAGELRLRGGDPVRAYQTMRGLSLVVDAVPQLVDATRGGRSFVIGQTAISALLAGRLDDALALFEKSLTAPVPAPLRFFRRDAHLRMGLIHALYGEPARAARHLAESRTVERTSCWPEEHLDWDERLLSALLAPEGEASSGLDEIIAVSAGHMGELWPMYVAGIGRLAVLARRGEAGRRRIEELADAGIAGSNRNGLSGSIIPVNLAIDALLAGAVSRAKPLIEAADPRFWQTKLLSALQAISAGAFARAVRVARSAGAQTRHLQQAEELRLLTVALAHFGAGNERGALEALRDLPTERGRLGVQLLTTFSPKLLEFAAARLPSWEDALPSGAHSTGVLDRVAFTERELEILAGLGRGEDRATIARTLFLSVNTIKTHQRSLYRKLGVSTASDAIREGRRRALL